MAAAKTAPEPTYEQRRDRTLARRLLLTLEARGAINASELTKLLNPSEADLTAAEALYD